MPQPPAYSPAVDFSDEERDNVGGRSTVRTAALDGEFSAIAASIAQTRTNLALNQRDDGEIRDGRVKLFTLASDVLALLTASGGTPRGPWTTATAYSYKDLVSQSGNTYMAVSAHTSGVFATDLAAGKWILFSLSTSPSASLVTFTPTATLSATDVQGAINEADIENRALSTAASNAAAAAAALATANDTALRSDLANTASTILGDAMVGVKRTAIGAGATNMHNWLEGQVINVRTDFGADATGATDATAAFTAALATGKSVFVPDGTYKVTSTLAISTAYQRIFGNGWGSQINFQLASPGAAITTSNSTGWQRIENLYLNGVSNCTKMISGGSPDLTARGNYIFNATATGHGIYMEDENVGANTYVFDAHIEGNLVYGVKAAGNYGIRLGTNHQATRVIGNSVQNWGYHLYINGATTQTTVMFNIFQRSDTAGATPASVVIHKAGSGMPAYGICVEHNYFEENLVCIYADDANLQNCSFSHNRAFRNTSSPVGAAFYKTGTATSAASTNLRADYNHCEGYPTFASLSSEYAANFASAKGNTLTHNATAYNVATAYVVGNTVTSGGITYYCIAPTIGNAPPNATYWLPVAYASGAWSDKIYTIRQHNAYFGSVIASGAYSTQSVTRQEAATGTFRVPVRWDPHEYLESFLLKYLRSAANPSITVNLHEVSVDTDTTIATSGAVSTDTIIVVNVMAFAKKNCHYYLEFICTTTGGITAYFYPAQLYLRQ